MYTTLKTTFPHSIITTNNSGLAIFSRLPFEKLPAAFKGDSIDIDGNVPGDTTDGEGRHSHVAFVKFEESCLPDTLAPKGALLARVTAPGGERRRYNLMVSHTQSDDVTEVFEVPVCSPAQVEEVRRTQFVQMAGILRDSGTVQSNSFAEQTVIGGDLNVQGWTRAFEGPGTVESPSPAMRSAEYGRSLWGGGAFDGLPFYDAWRLTSAEDDGAT